MNFIILQDYLLLPLYLILIYSVAYTIRNKKYGARHPVGKYYIPALTLKIIGALGVGMVYQYYYGGGDTENYFRNGTIVSRFASSDFDTFLKLVLQPISETYELRTQIAWTDSGFGFNESNYFPVRMLAVINIITLQNYLASAVLLAFISFTGIWKAYTSFVHLFPSLYKKLAVAFLFIPSVFFWGSGILKDSIVIGALGWLFFGSYRLFILRIKLFSSALIVFLSIYCILIVKPYVAQAFLPSMVFWIFFQYRSRIQNEFLRTMALPFLLVLVTAGSLFLIGTLSTKATDSGSFELKTLTNKAATFNANNKDAGSAVNIGITDNMGPADLVKVAPLAIITTLFRPFVFEAKNVFMLLSAFESTYMLYLFVSVLFRIGLPRMMKTAAVPLVSFCLVFSLVFAFAVGFSTSNFGTLVRYKIPCIPFFMAAVFIISDTNETVKRKRLTHLKKVGENDHLAR